MIRRLCLSLAALALLAAAPVASHPPEYSFRIVRETVDAFWNADGTLSIDYTFDFYNNLLADPIDYVDVGVPNANYSLASVTASVDGVMLTDIQRSEYVDPGVAVGLGARAIPPGGKGAINVNIGRVEKVLYPDDDDSNYASAVFSPTWFGSQYVSGVTDLTVTFHLPPGIQSDQPRYHIPQNWPCESEPSSALDDEERIIYVWHCAVANGSTQYTFGASFPADKVPADSITRPSFLEPILAAIGVFVEAAMPCLCICGTFGFFVAIAGFGAVAERQRKKQYLPPKISIEGHGIKRGLTAVEAAVLGEQPLDKVMTMILFGVVKKGAATVVSREPLELKVSPSLPEGLNEYEKDFLDAMRGSPMPDALSNVDAKTAGAAAKPAPAAARRKALQDMTIKLINSLSEKMKGFSRKETIAYYATITDKAWQQVTAAGTPEVKAQALDENLEWTMADKNFNDRSQEVWRGGPVYVPMWWGHYDPAFGRASMAPVTGGGVQLPTTVQLPHLPGADFAGSVVKGVQNFSSGVIGDLTGFTGRITDKTNPVPVSTSSGGRHSGGGGSHCACACACACAGCACACAGGGR